MAASTGPAGPPLRWVPRLVLLVELLFQSGLTCAPNCTCNGLAVDCSGRGLTDVPRSLPSFTVSLNLSHNKLTELNQAALGDLLNLRELYLGHNELTAIPSLGDLSSSIVSLHLHHNKIRSIEAGQLQPYVSLVTLDLTSNEITEVRSGSIPHGLKIKDLYLGSNRIGSLEPGAFDNLSRTLQVLRLSRNRIAQLPTKAFKLPRLMQLDLNRNRIRVIEGLTFQGLDNLETLKLQRNNISKLTDGAFWGPARMQTLFLDNNGLTEVNGGSLYGLSALLSLHLSNNSISRINPDSWRFCQKLHELTLSYNSLTRLEDDSLMGLGVLHILRLSHNSISHITEGAFRGLRALRTLELDHNEISGTIEDTNGAFTGLESLSKLTLFGNKIKSVAKRAFSGLEALEHLNLADNAIRSIQAEAFAKMKNLKELYIKSESFLCDCQLRWFPEWLLDKGLQSSTDGLCAHPEVLKSSSIFSVPADSFVCDDFPKPQIIVQPETTMAVLGKDVRFTCTAASSSSSPMIFAWRKDQEFLRDANMENFAHVRAKDGEMMEYTTILHLQHVSFAEEGRYQCIITNHFGSTYSSKARLTVNVLPSFVKTPRDITIRTGTTARLECAAEGHPTPQIAWQKDGGTDFPAARERRMHVMPDDDVFFIMDVKIEDMGVYSCTAQNTAGNISASATLTVLETPYLAQELEDHNVAVGDTVALQCKALGSPTPRITWLKEDEPLRVTERHHFTPGNQLLVIRNAGPEDAGKYTCVMSNTLGTERAHSHLSIQQSSVCMVEPHKRENTMTVGIIVIAVVCSIVLTSLVWVCIIYQTRKKSEEYSVTNTDETIVPPDVPSYLSSQGTLSDRQDMCLRLETNIGPSPNGHIESNGVCRSDAVACVDPGAHGTCRQVKPCAVREEDRDKGGYRPAAEYFDATSSSAPPQNCQCGEMYQQELRASNSNINSCSRGHEPSRGAPDTCLRRDLHTSRYPSNHDRMSDTDHQGSPSWTRGSAEPPDAVRFSALGSGLGPDTDGSFPSCSLDSRGIGEAGQTFKMNGHLSDECSSLRKASD
ncbi:leucine-rich repeats and immunoglobulin-like domains protein 1 [Erpetoichthys calabaricus]|uniref:Leucine rich repeats and immunoglobulin like domains 1 n=1 Tax=Erpetoichthys calabaricus TaxID=27687 RepID=A0A8C4XDU4_ERPCA|nr:leucine-rich repeats and immunoglobulin-like domains protein 1 [Erpetoichthys calabaricus]